MKEIPIKLGFSVPDGEHIDGYGILKEIVTGGHLRPDPYCV